MSAPDLKPPLPPMEARSVDNIPVGDEWQYEPKWDGFRCVAFRDGTEIYLQSKAGQPLARYFPDVVEALGKVGAKRFVLDGELVIPVQGALSFDELQLRLHPAASRVQKLAAAHPALLVVFDLLGDEAGKSLLSVPLARAAREAGAFRPQTSAPRKFDSSLTGDDRSRASDEVVRSTSAAISTAWSRSKSTPLTPPANAPRW